MILEKFCHKGLRRVQATLDDAQLVENSSVKELSKKANSMQDKE